jgi:hypothetical protein
MATSSPEIKVETPPQIDQVLEQYPEGPVEVAEGIQATPVTPTHVPTVQIPSGQVITPVPAEPSPQTLVIPADPPVLAQQSHGSVSDTSTWNAFFWLRMIKKALLKHFQIVVGNQKT